ncbi:hypothetical protein SEMRO_976_G226910.1 [Seminavis robusta]|uniref:Uncharacterized protein n=1 Tax=Seminavis robusta TaxID=568900 RepID=A0A9N8HM80_9STRA|nr:hypothetical protein SEMRO_976_G226910.1 [Seminavis robusta]|eukprot:Sro976_g226910.1 n/a (206) ;mRNA; r:3199-3816
MYNQQAFEAFVRAKGDVFPFNQLKKTRSSFRTRWVLLKSPSPTGIIYRPTKLFALPASCIRNDLLQEGIIAGNYLPLPPDYCDVLDCMEWWGRGVDPKWEQSILGMFEYYLANPEIFSIAGRKELFYDCITLHIETKYSYIDGLNKTQEMEYWPVYFGYLYESTTDYFELATASIRYADNRLWVLHHYHNTANSGGATPDEVHSD